MKLVLFSKKEAGINNKITHIKNTLKTEEREKLAQFLLLQQNDIKADTFQIEVKQSAHLIQQDSIASIGAKNIVKYLSRAKTKYTYEYSKNTLEPMYNKALRIFRV